MGSSLSQAVAQVPPLTLWGQETPHLASVTLSFFICTIQTVSPPSWDSVTQDFLGADFEPWSVLGPVCA